MRDLVKQAQQGDQDAFAVLVERCQDAVYGTAYALLGDFHDAQDMAQEAFVQAWRDLGQLKDPARFPGWVCRITRNRCLDFLRRPVRPTRPLDVTAHGVPGPPDTHPGKRAERGELRDEVLALIASLTEPNRLATTLFYIDGYGVDEVAAFLEIPAGTVKRRLHDSRKQLKERMVGMVEDTLKGAPLPDDFARRTVERAVAQARRMNAEDRHAEAESILRQTLNKSPGHPAALKELNRALLHGKVYGNDRWDLLPELVEHGRTILATNDGDEDTRREVARSLLAIPAMGEAVDFIEHWCAEKGQNLERLGMLAWALGCVADYSGAQETWRRLVKQGTASEPVEIRNTVPMACDALVDCLTAANRTDEAKGVARAGFDLCASADMLQAEQRHLAAPWPRIYKQAGLDDECMAVAKACFGDDNASPVGKLCARVWFDEPGNITEDWLAWLREQAACGRWPEVREAGHALATAFLRAALHGARQTLASATSTLLSGMSEAEAVRSRDWWEYLRYEGVAAGFLWDDDHANAERVARDGIAAGREPCWWIINDLAVLRREPSPRELMQDLQAMCPDATEKAGIDGWYHIAREAAASGDEIRAFDALERASRLWCNPPLWRVALWEKDTRWGSLRNHPEFARIVGAKRQRIGPVYGELKYFPGW